MYIYVCVCARARAIAKNPAGATALRIMAR